MNNRCTCSAIILLQNSMPLVSSKDICPGTWLTQYYQKLMVLPWNESNSPVEYCRLQKRVSKETTYISSPKDWRSSTISQSHRGWFSQERRPEIKFLYQRAEAHSTTKEQDAHIHANNESPLLAPLCKDSPMWILFSHHWLRKNRGERSSQTQLITTTNWHFSWKHNAVKNL